jgi:hypothetical protein
MSASATSAPLPPGDRLHAAFLAVLPRIELHAQLYFRHLKCAVKKEDAVQEVLALAWKWFARLAERGKDATQFVSALACYAPRAVRCGRRVCGHERVKEVLSPVAQRRHGFAVEFLPASTQTSHEHLSAPPHGQQRQDAFEERLRDNTRTPVPEQAAFRIDFPAWRGTRSERDRRVVDDLMAGGRTKDVSRKFGMSPSRVSQLRREFMEDWRRFHGGVA